MPLRLGARVLVLLRKLSRVANLLLLRSCAMAANRAQTADDAQRSADAPYCYPLSRAHRIQPQPPSQATRRSESRPIQSTAPIRFGARANRDPIANRGFNPVGYASVRGENMRSGLLEQRDDLFALHTRKALKKLLDRVPCFQMIEEAPGRHPRAHKHWLAPEYLGILRNDAAHSET